MYDSVEDIPESLRDDLPETEKDDLLLELVNTAGEDALDRIKKATSVELGEKDTIVVHGHRKGSTVRHPTGNFQVDDWFVNELTEGFDKLTKLDYRPPLLRQHKPDPNGKASQVRDPKGPRPIEDGFNYGRIVEVVDSESPRGQELKETRDDVPNKEGVWYVTEVPGPVKQAHEAGFIQHWSPSFYRDWTPPHPEMGEKVPLAPRHLAFVSIPHQKDLDSNSPHYDLDEKMAQVGASVDLGETRGLQLQSISSGEAIELAATEHRDWPVASLNREWNVSGAHQRLVEHFEAEGEGPLPEGFVQAHLFYPEDDRQEGNISAGKLPVVDIVDGKPKYIPRAARAADRALAGAREEVDLPSGERDEVESRLDTIYSLISDKFPEEWPETPSILRNESSDNEEQLMSEDVEELKEEIAELKEGLSQVTEAVTEDEPDEDPELVEMREQKQKLEESVEDLQKKRLRDNLENQGVDLEEIDEDLDELMELSQTDPAEYTRKVTQAVGDVSTPSPDSGSTEVGGTGSPPEQEDPDEEFEETVRELEEKYEPGSQALINELAERGYEDRVTL